MRSICKGEAPDFWNQYVSKHSEIRYKQADPEVIKQLKNHMLESQGYLCAYCCKQISEGSSHNEHIKPEDSYPNLTMDYENLVVSCTVQGDASSSVCGMHKGNSYDESLFVSPLYPNCSEHFQFNHDGTIEGIDKQGSYTIKLLNLNAYSLVSARRALIHELNNCRDLGTQYIQENYMNRQEGRFPRFVDMVEYLMKTRYFENIDE